MKTFLFTLAILINTSTIFAQECESYFPQIQGKKYTYQDLDKKGKVTGSTTKTVVKKSSIADGVEITIKEESNNKDAEAPTTIEYTIKCKNGEMSVDMESMLMNNEQMQAYDGMETKVTADNITIPQNAKAGDNLGGGKATAEVFNQGMKMMSLSFYITDRKVDAIETITTDAGTFECIKITSHTEFKMVVTVKATITEWYSKGVGIVKSETYNKKGKLMASTVLSSIE